MEVKREPRASWVAHGMLDRFATGLPARLDARIEGRFGCVRFVRNDALLFGAIELDEAALEVPPEVPSDVPRADVAQAGEGRLPVEVVTREAYDALFGCLEAQGFPYLARVWNFIPDIIGEQAGHERYRLFNIARQQAFAAAGRALTDDVPAATGIGLDSRRLQIYFIASRTRALPIENPRQISAFHYPPQYGRKSPTFARAVVMPLDSGPLLLVSGTASIVGHETVHRDDVVAQTHEIFANLSALIAEANRRMGDAGDRGDAGNAASRVAFTLADLSYRVYVRRAADFDAVRAVVDRHLGMAATPAASATLATARPVRYEIAGSDADADADGERGGWGEAQVEGGDDHVSRHGSQAAVERHYVRADICRPDLLVEIDASGGGGARRARSS